MMDYLLDCINSQLPANLMRLLKILKNAITLAHNAPVFSIIASSKKLYISVSEMYSATLLTSA